VKSRHLIDAHVHLNNYHEATRRPVRENIADLRSKMTECGIDHAVVISSYRIDPDRPSIEELNELIDIDDHLTLVEGLRWRSESRTDLFEMEERIRDGYVKGDQALPGV